MECQTPRNSPRLCTNHQATWNASGRSRQHASPPLSTCHQNPPPSQSFKFLFQLHLLRTLIPSSYLDLISDSQKFERAMADRGQPRQTTGRITDSVKSILPDRGPTKSQALTVATLFPTGGLLLTLSFLTLAATVVGLGFLTPVFLLFSPVLVPAALLMGLAVTGFITSGALGLGGLSSLACFARAARDLVTKAPDTIEVSKRKMAEAAATVGQKGKEVGQAIQSKAQEAAGKTDK